MKEQVLELYKLYPARCVTTGRSLGKSRQKNFAQIERLLKKLFTFDELEKAIKWYIKDCDTNSSWMMNFSTFLNNVPDVDEFEEEVQIVFTSPATGKMTMKKSAFAEYKAKLEAKGQEVTILREISG